jgi:hypothetical protein
LVSKINKNYEGLFGEEILQDETETEQEVIKNVNPFIWLSAADNVAEVGRIPILDTFDLPIYEFLNLLSYVSYKIKIRRTN